MSSSEDEEGGNGRAKALMNLLTRSCKDLLEIASASEVPVPQTLKIKGTHLSNVLSKTQP